MRITNNYKFWLNLNLFERFRMTKFLVYSLAADEELTNKANVKAINANNKPINLAAQKNFFNQICSRCKIVRKKIIIRIHYP